MTKPYLIIIRMDVDERADHPANWDWTTLLDLPDSGGVQVLMAQEITNLDDDKVLKGVVEGT
jgi:hypothetical protein